MNDWTIISYPSSKDNSLLSLTEARSRYMLPFGGRFRIIDFTLRNAFVSEARNIIIYSNVEDTLEQYVNEYNYADNVSEQNEEKKAVKEKSIRVITNEYSDINFCKKLINESDTRYFILYNGDYPSIIDFTEIMKRYSKSRSDSLLFTMIINGKPSMAYRLLVTNRKTLLKIINRTIKEKRSSPNIFEMIINYMINSKIKKTSFNAHYWPISNVPEYYNLSRKILWDKELFDLIYSDNRMKSKIYSEEKFAQIGESAIVINSFLSDNCYINGRLENSVIYPGVEIGRDSYVKDSIILPYVKIGSGSRIIKTIIDESTRIDPESSYINIGNVCRIGTEDENIKNSDFPKSLFSSITMIGKNCKILDDAKIGGACYIASELGEAFFTQKKYLYDGSSLIK